MVNRTKVIALALIISGVVLLLGGFAMDRSGNIVNVLPVWTGTIGAILLGTGSYVYAVYVM
jgi:hypothetical protein